MTDTDDTDDLLLIPPDFFTIKSDSEHSEVIDPYYNIVDSLIKQVGKLQNRIKSIESTESFLSNSLDYTFGKDKKMHNSVKGFRKYNSSDELYVPDSSQSTPQKSSTKYKLNSLPNTPYSDKFKTKTTPEFKSSKYPAIHKRDKLLEDRNTTTKREIRDSKSSNISSKNADLAGEDTKMLNEIDTFLSKVKTIQRLNAVRNLDCEFDSCVTAPLSDNNKKLQQVLSDFDEQQKKLEIINSKMNTEDSTLSKEKPWRLVDDKQTVPDLGGIRDTLYKTQGKELLYDNQPSDCGDHYNQVLHLTNQSSIANDSLTSTDRYPVSDSSTDSTQITAYNKYNKMKSTLLDDSIHSNALNVLNMHKQVLEDSAEKIGTKNRIKDQKPRSTNTVSNNLQLVNLADIWNTTKHLPHMKSSQIMQKLQEEKLRRQHCENLIHELQTRNLELQQKLSVAVKVDESKNKVISQFQDALEKAVGKIQVIQKEKRDWESEVIKLKNRHKNEMDESLQKIGYYEKELSKALNVVKNNQDKLNSLEMRCSELQNEMQNAETNYRETKDMLNKETDRNKQLTAILSEKELEINENKNTLNNARSEVAKSKKAVEICQEEFAKLKDECGKLRSDLKTENNQIMFLTEEKRELQKEVENYKKKQNELQEELSRTVKHLESNKVDLKNFYQGQVEILVQNKLKEFQAQLDQAETNFKEEMKKRELSIAKTAAIHIQQISEKYSLEINLIEKKHQEETKLYQIQIMQYKQQIDGLQNKIDLFQEKRVQVAKQLQKIMETQWSEALRIIATGKSPTFNEDSFSTIDQLNSLKTRSYNNVEEILIQNEGQLNAGKNQTESQPMMFDKGNEEKINREDMETPVSSRTQGNKQYTDHEIQKYINLLLNRQPGSSEVFVKEADKMESERASWISEQMESFRPGSKSSKDRKSQKPPWK